MDDDQDQPEEAAAPEPVPQPTFAPAQVSAPSTEEAPPQPPTPPPDPTSWEAVQGRFQQAFPNADPDDMRRRYENVRRAHQVAHLVDESARRHAALGDVTENMRNRQWQETADAMREVAPDFNADAMRDNYDRSRRMWTARMDDAVEGDAPAVRAIRAAGTVFPGASTLFPALEQHAYEGARDRYEAGTATDQDYRTIAKIERRRQEDAQRQQEANSTNLGRAGSILAQLPATYIEMAIGGQAARTMIGGTSMLARGGRFATQLAATPSMWQPAMMRNNEENDRPWYDPRGLPVGLAQGAMVQAIFGQMNPIAEAVTSRLGGGGLLGRLAGAGAAGTTGLIEDWALHTVQTNAGLDMGYGSLGNLMRDDPTKWGDVLGNFMAFAGLSQMHNRESPVMERLALWTSEQATQGTPRAQAAARLERLLLPFQHPDITPERAREIAQTMPEGPTRDLARSIADSIPEQRPSIQRQTETEQGSAQAPPTEHLPPYEFRTPPEAQGRPIAATQTAPEAQGAQRPAGEPVRPENQSWHNQGTEFRDHPDGQRFEFTGSNGKTYSIEHEAFGPKEPGDLGHTAVRVKDADGNNVGIADAWHRSDGNVEVHFMKHSDAPKDLKGLGAVMHDYVDRAIGNIVHPSRSEFGLHVTDAGNAVWRRNAERAVSRPEGPGGPAYPGQAPEGGAAGAPAGGQAARPGAAPVEIPLKDLQDAARFLGLKTNGDERALESRILANPAGAHLLAGLRNQPHPVETAVANPHPDNLIKAVEAIQPEGLPADLQAQLEAVRALARELPNEIRQVSRSSGLSETSIRHQIHAGLREESAHAEAIDPSERGPQGHVPGTPEGAAEMGGSSPEAVRSTRALAAAGSGAAGSHELIPLYHGKPLSEIDLRAYEIQHGEKATNNMLQRLARGGDKDAKAELRQRVEAGPAPPPPPEGAPDGWEHWTNFQKQHYLRAGRDWIKQNVQLRNNGQKTLADEIMDRGGIDKGTVPGDLEHWTDIFGKGMWQTKGMKPLALDTLAEELRRRFPGEFTDQSQHPEERVLEMLRDHYLADAGHQIEVLAKSEEFRNARNEFGREFIQDHPEANEVEVERAFQAYLDQDGEAEARGRSPVEVVRAEGKDSEERHGRAREPSATGLRESDDFPFGANEPGEPAGAGSAVGGAGAAGGPAAEAGAQPTGPERATGGLRSLVSGLVKGESGSAWVPSAEVLAEQMQRLRGQQPTAPGTLPEPAKPRPNIQGTVFRDRQGNIIRGNPQSVGQRVFKTGTDLMDASRAIITSADLSAVLRQGAMFTAAHPIKAAKAFAEGIKAFVSEAASDRVMQEIRSRPNAKLYEQAGLYLADRTKITGQEEGYIGRLVGKIPGLAGSERAYSTFLNRMRADVFDSMAASVGKRGQLTPVEAHALANFVNVASGRGGLGFLEEASVPLARLFFAPRFVASRFQLLAGQPFYQGSMRTRLAVGSEYAKSLIGLGLFYTAAKLAGGDDVKIEMDPRSSDFGKVHIRNTRIDPLAGLSQMAVFGSRLVTGETKSTTTGRVSPLRGNVPFGGQTVASVIGNFIRSKAAPVPGAILDALTGQNVVGERLTPGSMASNLLLPMSVRDVWQAMTEDEGLPRGVAASLLAILGMGTQVYDLHQQRARAVAR